MPSTDIHITSIQYNLLYRTFTKRFSLRFTTNNWVNKNNSYYSTGRGVLERAGTNIARPGVSRHKDDHLIPFNNPQVLVSKEYPTGLTPLVRLFIFVPQSVSKTEFEGGKRKRVIFNESDIVGYNS